MNFSASRKQKLLGDEREKSDQQKTIEPKQTKLSSFFSKLKQIDLLFFEAHIFVLLSGELFSCLLVSTFISLD